MLHLKDVSLRYKVPLRVAALVIGTAFAVTSLMVYHALDDLRSNLIANADSMGRLLANTLIGPMLHDDVWRSYEIINTPLQVINKSGPIKEAPIILILDIRQHVYVSTQPNRYPILSDPRKIDSDFIQVLKTKINPNMEQATVVESLGSDKLFMLTPIDSDGVLLGTLVMGYSKSIFIPRFQSLMLRAALATLLVLAFLLPLGIYWGRRMARPLIELADAMGRVGPILPEPDEIDLEESKDEIGQLSKAFKEMLVELKEKASLEQQIVLADRLSAIGRLAASVAHEINNPLGGMLNAINTYRRHGTQDPMTLKTISLLERGLIQIKDTVAALLVEAKVKSHPLSRSDVDDVRKLIQPDSQAKKASLVWENDLVDVVPLPSTLLRQVMINLLLNAVHAIHQGGNIGCHIYRNSDSLVIDVRNDGAHIPQEKVPYLFEPFTPISENGSGLGLWVTYQIVQQLGGQITVQSEPGDTRFTIQIPIQEIHE